MKAWQWTVMLAAFAVDMAAFVFAWPTGIVLGAAGLMVGMAIRGLE